MNKYLALFLSIVLIAFGLSCQVSVSYVGAEPWTAFHEALAVRWFTIGTWTVVFQALFLLLTYLGDKKKTANRNFCEYDSDWSLH